MSDTTTTTGPDPASPQPGDRYTANGVRFTVQFTDDEWVYGVRYWANLAPEAINAAIDAGYDPPGYLGNVRVRRTEFVGAVAAPAADRRA